MKEIISGMVFLNTFKIGGNIKTFFVYLVKIVMRHIYDREVIEENLKRLQPLNYNRFMWWRTHARKNKLLSKQNKAQNYLNNHENNIFKNLFFNTIMVF